eukprot:Skav232546  [mRNA]  locus=scaffold7124:11520:14952:+ [translate_table: standard]
MLERGNRRGFDAGEQEQHIAEVYLRSHFAATFLPQRRSVVVFGGSRYFTGAPWLRRHQGAWCPGEGWPR